MNITLFVIAFLGLFALLTMYISRRLVHHLHLSERKKKLFRYFLYLNYIGILLYGLARYSGEFPNWLFFLVSLPIGVLFLLFCTAVLYDILRVILHFSPISSSRRAFFKKSLDIASLTMAVAVTARSIYEARDVKIEDVNIKIKNLQQAYSIVQLSDIHIGGLIDAAFMKDVVKRVNKLSPDVIVITGDLVDIKLSSAHDALEALTKLKAKYGIYFIVGNHEYFHGVAKIIERVKSLGIRVLENENIYIGDAKRGFNLAGVYDMFGYRVGHHLPDLSKALVNRDENSPTLLLAHQPLFIDEVKSGVDLMLSGHTHGGQLYPFQILVKLQQHYIRGLHQHNENLQIYVNKGTGFWGPPMRLGANSEITHIHLT